MSNEFRERRKENRSSSGLSAVVKGRESKADFWKESTDLVTVSRIGASFELQRACQVGRILSILANMPANLRCYDEDKKQYRVWGLVQHCSPVYENPDLFLVGVAFIGKYAPKTYLEDPLRTYRVVGMDEEGFWNVGETKEPFVSRAYHRFKYAAGVKLGNLKTEGEANSIDFDAVTEDVGSGGASVFTSLDVETGDAVRFVCD